MAARDSRIIRQIPNVLTLGRLICVPIFIALMFIDRGTSIAAGIIFVAASLTDFLDGMLARRLGVMSQFGKVVDPIADRLLVNSAACTLCWFDSRLFGWEWILVVARDVVGMYGYRRLRKHVLVPDVTRLGKVGMFSMMFGLSFLLLLKHAEWPVPFFQIGLLLSIIALGQYAWRYRFALQNPAAAGFTTPSGDICSDDPT